MRSQIPQNAEAVLGETVFPRDFLELTVRSRLSGEPIVERLWSDRYDVTAPVIDLETGLAVTLEWQGAAGLVSISDLSFVSNLTVSEATITLAAYGVDVDRLLREYDASQAKVRIWRGFLDINSRLLVANFLPHLDFFSHAQYPRMRLEAI